MKNLKKALKLNKKGFTLVELIVVIAILGVLAAILVPSFTGYVAKAGRANEVATAKSWCTAYQAAYADNQAGNGTLDSNLTALGVATTAPLRATPTGAICTVNTDTTVQVTGGK